MSNHALLHHGLQQAGHGIADIVQKFINHAVQTDFNAFALRRAADGGILADVESQDDRGGGAGQQHVVLSDVSNARENHFQRDFVALDAGKGLLYRFEGALHIGLQNDRELPFFVHGRLT